MTTAGVWIGVYVSGIHSMVIQGGPFLSNWTSRGRVIGWAQLRSPVGKKHYVVIVVRKNASEVRTLYWWYNTGPLVPVAVQ